MVTAARKPFLVATLVLLAACRGDDSKVELVGSVERTLVELSVPVSEVITALPFDRGQHVDAGDVIARLDATLAQAEVARAEAEVAAMRAHSLVAARDLERIAGLHRKKIASEDQLEHAQLAADEAGARLREAEARLQAASKHLRDCTVVTPVAGVVDQLPFDVGERVPAGAVVAVLLRDGDPWVRVWVPERAIARLAPGMRATVAVDGIAGVIHGRILDIAREPEFTPHYALTERERTYLVYETRVLLEGVASLRPGTPATVILTLPPWPAEAVP